MQNIRHKPIKKFSLSGTIYDDAQIFTMKQNYLKLLDFQMRCNGYVFRLDMGPEFALQYNDKTETFSFYLATYGVYVGKRKSEWIFGVDEHKIVPIPLSKSRECSSEAV
jgi:hypothetical protein